MLPNFIDKQVGSPEVDVLRRFLFDFRALADLVLPAAVILQVQFPGVGMQHAPRGSVLFFPDELFQFGQLLRVKPFVFFQKERVFQDKGLEPLCLVLLF